MNELELPKPNKVKSDSDIKINKENEMKRNAKEMYVIMMEFNCGCSSCTEKYVSNVKPLRMTNDIGDARIWLNLEDVRIVQDKMLAIASKKDDGWMPYICLLNEDMKSVSILDDEIEREIKMREEENKGKEVNMNKTNCERHVVNSGTLDGKSIVMVSAGIVASSVRKANRLRKAHGFPPYGQPSTDRTLDGKSIVMVSAGIVAAGIRKANKLRSAYGLPPYTSKQNSIHCIGF